MKFTFRGFSGEMRALRLTFSVSEEKLLSVLIHFFENERWRSPIQMGVEGQSLSAEDHLFILMQARSIPNSHARSRSTRGTNLLRARGIPLSFA